MSTQTDLFAQSASAPAVEDSDAEKMRRHLDFYGCWRTRAQICSALGWTERQVREAAEQLGSDVVRCQSGLKLTDKLERDDLGVAKQACDAFESQAKKMLSYSESLRRRLHQLIG